MLKKIFRLFRRKPEALLDVLHHITLIAHEDPTTQQTTPGYQWLIEIDAKNPFVKREAQDFLYDKLGDYLESAYPHSGRRIEKHWRDERSFVRPNFFFTRIEDAKEDLARIKQVAHGYLMTKATEA